MGLERIKVERDQNYSTVHNGILHDKTISLKAKGLHVTVMTFPPDWNFTVAGLIKVVKEGKDAVYSAIAELRDAGYVQKQPQTQNVDDGTFQPLTYTFFELPQPHPENPHPENPHPENPHPDNPDTDNPPQLKKHVLSIQNQNRERETGRSTPLGIPVNAEKHANLDAFLDTARDAYGTLSLPNERRWLQAAIDADAAGLSPAEFGAALRQRINDPSRKYNVTPEQVVALALETRARASTPAEPDIPQWKKDRDACPLCDADGLVWDGGLSSVCGHGGQA